MAVAEDRRQATAAFHVEVELCTPLPGDFTAAKMARLQGNVAESRWEAGRFAAKYVKRGSEWKIVSLAYAAL